MLFGQPSLLPPKRSFLQSFHGDFKICFYQFLSNINEKKGKKESFLWPWYFLIRSAFVFVRMASWKFCQVERMLEQISLHKFLSCERSILAVTAGGWVLYAAGYTFWPWPHGHCHPDTAADHRIYTVPAAETGRRHCQCGCPWLTDGKIQ